MNTVEKSQEILLKYKQNHIIDYMNELDNEEKECSNHNQDAKKLKIDIENEIERLKNLQKNKEEKSEKENKEEKEQPKNEDAIEEKIKDIKEQSTEEQRKIEYVLKDFNQGHKNWGKNW